MTRRFTRTTESFDCTNCGAHVVGDGFTNHCPRCLWSRHVDENPGDRAASCRGAMKPIAIIAQRDELVVVQECVVCGHRWRNRTSPDDDRALVIRLSATPLRDSSGAPHSSRQTHRPHRRRPR
jgi:hypothetical protein